MGAADGTVVGFSKIVDNGPATERFNLVLVAEGYRAAELTQFSADAQQFVNRLLATAPFGAYEAALNVYRVDVSSTDSGADDPTACGGTGATAATYFDASFCNGGIRRLLRANTALVLNVVGGLVPEWHQILVIVNSPIWGGGGGTIAVTSTAGGWEDMAIHEFGHAAFGLADEYEYWAGCGTDTTQNNWAGGEPAEPNVTANVDRATIKWGHLVAAATPLPTTSNANCAQCDPQPSPVPAGTVGAFEGAKYFHCGLYRPEFNCMMRNLTGFCAVCQERIEDVLEPFLPALLPGRLKELLQHMRLEHRLTLPPWILVAYLIVNERMKALQKTLGLRPSSDFYETVARHLGAYLRKQRMPPAEIAGPILNLADDYLANRQMSLRAGDYIALQSFVRARRATREPRRARKRS